MTHPIPIFVINLERAVQRRAEMTAQFEAIGLEPQWVKAMDVLEEPEHVIYDGFARRGPWGPLRIGDVACCQSHKRAWQAVVDAGTEIGLILEDDVILSQTLPDWLAGSDWWPQGAGIVKLERWKSRTMKIVLGQAVANVHGSDLCPLISRHPGAAAYFLTRETAKKLLAIDPQTTPMDGLLFAPLTKALPRDITVLQASPALAYQQDDGAEQMPASGRPKLPTGQKIRQELRRGWLELTSGLAALPKLIFGRATLRRLPLVSDLEGQR